MIPQLFESIFKKRGLFWLVFLGVTGVLTGASLWVITFVQNQTSEVVEELSPAEAELSMIYVNYNSNPADYVSAEAYLTMGEYLRENPQPQNVQVLEGLNTQEVVGYMLNVFSAGMEVDCAYCHNVDNYAADEWDDEQAMANKSMARQHLLMTQDINQTWLTELDGLTDLKQPSGSQVICATCHLGEAQPVTYPAGEFALPDDFRLPLDQPLDQPDDILNVNARKDISLDQVQYQQQIMYYMNASLNVGCTHCHNSRYFPSWEVPAKYYAQHMVEMTQYINDEWGDTLGEQEPSCQMCHYGAPIPPGAAVNTEVIPAPLVP